MSWRVENYRDGVLVDTEELIDIAGAITYRRTVLGSVVEERPATTEERAVYTDEVRQQRIDILGTDFTNGIKTLRKWSTQAQATTVTKTNAIAILQVMVDRQGVFFDRFADLLVLLGQADIDDFD